MGTRAVVYCRISDDRTGEAAGVERQLKDCRKHCKRNGWEVVGEFIDNDVSASSYSKKVRPEYRKMIAAVEAGDADCIVSWHLDRLWRRPRELEDLVDIAETGVGVATIQGDLSLATSDGRAMARILVTMAAKSSDDASFRIRRQDEAAATAGRYHGGRRPYGYAADGVTVVDAEADVIRTMVSMALAGVGYTGVARHLNSEGIRPVTAKEWSTRTVRDILRSPRIAGRRLFRGEVVGDAEWDPIIDLDTWTRLQTMVAPKAQRPGRRSLLTALVRCGRCGSTLTRGTDGTTAIWRCHPGPGRPQCGHLSIRAVPLEEHIVDAVLTVADLGQLPKAPRNGNTKKLHDELARAEQRLTEAAEAAGTGTISVSEWVAYRRPLEERLKELRGQLERRTGDRLAQWRQPGALREAWPGLDLDQQRAVLVNTIDFIRVLPLDKTAPRKVNLDRVQVHWRA